MLTWNRYADTRIGCRVGRTHEKSRRTFENKSLRGSHFDVQLPGGGRHIDFKLMVYLVGNKTVRNRVQGISILGSRE